MRNTRANKIDRNKSEKENNFLDIRYWHVSCLRNIFERKILGEKGKKQKDEDVIQVKALSVKMIQKWSMRKDMRWTTSATRHRFRRMVMMINIIVIMLYYDDDELLICTTHDTHVVCRNSYVELLVTSIEDIKSECTQDNNFNPSTYWHFCTSRTWRLLSQRLMVLLY